MADAARFLSKHSQESIVQYQDDGRTKVLKAPLFNLEHLLSKSIPELEGSGFNLCVQLSVQYSSFDQLQCGHQVFLAANFNCHFAFS